MTSQPDPALSFGGVAAAYHRGRPTYPLEAATWLTGPAPLDVLELGAGTGKLTAALVALGHDVHATDPDLKMLDQLGRHLPDVRITQAGAEEIPADDQSLDVVIAGQAFHWFDHDVALAEIARVLRPGGHIALVWNYRDERIPWVRKLGALIGRQEHVTADMYAPIEDSGLFEEVEASSYPFWQTVDRTSIVDLVASRSNVATLDPEAREEKLAAVLALYDDYGRGMDGMQLPYSAHCFRAQVSERPVVQAAPPEPVIQVINTRTSSHEDTQPIAMPPAKATPAGIPFSGQWTGEDTELLLIDFS